MINAQELFDDSIKGSDETKVKVIEALEQLFKDITNKGEFGVFLSRELAENNEYLKILLRGYILKSPLWECIKEELQDSGYYVSNNFNDVIFIHWNKSYKDEEKVTIREGQTWVKQTEQWLDNDPKGTKVKVANYTGSGVYYKKSFFGEKYYLNETSFRRIFKFKE